MRNPGSRLGTATLVLFANAIGVIAFLRARADALMGAVVDPLHPDEAVMVSAFDGYALYAVSLVAVVALGALVVARTAMRRVEAPASDPPTATRRNVALTTVLAVVLTTAVVLTYVEVLIFQDYGVHLYEFDVLGILTTAALRRDLGIQPAEVARVVTAALALFGAELLLFAVAHRLARWRGGTLARACAASLVIAVPGGFLLFRTGEAAIITERAEFAGALPLGASLLWRSTTRPHIAVEPRLGPAGYPMLAAGGAAPRLARKRNIVFFVADGLRGDMIRPALTPNLLDFAARADVIRSAQHFSTGHVSESGVFGLLYGVDGQAFHSFLQARVAAYPLEVLKRNGYHTLLLASSRLNPYPSDQLISVFDEVAYPATDDEAVSALARYVTARRADGKPYFVFVFFYTPHYPFTSAKAAFRRLPPRGAATKSNYMNDVLQADDYFRQAFEVVRGDYDAARTVVLATSDHGEEIRDHGTFGHASATFWNEKIEVPFLLGLPGVKLAPLVRTPALTSHVDLWPTLFDYLGAEPRVDPHRYSDGRSLLAAPTGAPRALVTGRFFPYADRPSVLVDGSRKYWFRVSGIGPGDRLCAEISRVTDLDDRPVAVDLSTISLAAIPAFDSLQATFWRFIQPVVARTPRSIRAGCRS
jgi:hypothetical protein